MIIATCGHKVTEETENFINTKDYSRGGDRVVSSQTVCNECLSLYKDEILYTKKQEEKWLKTKKKTNIL